MHLLDLNYECLEHIFKMLPLKDQLNVFMASPQLGDIIKDIWRRHYWKQRRIQFEYGKSNSPETIVYPTSRKGFVQLLSVLCKHTEELDVNHTTLLHLMATQKWPKLRTLDANIDEINDKLANPTKIFQQFPALQTLELNYSVKIYERVFDVFFKNSLCDIKTVDMGIKRAAHFLDEEDMEMQVDVQITKSHFLLEGLAAAPQTRENQLRLDQMKDYIQVLRGHADRLRAQVSVKRNIVKAIHFENLRQLSILGFYISDLPLDKMPLLEELYFRNPRVHIPDVDVNACRKSLAYVKRCVEKQVRENRRQVPLKLVGVVYFSIMHELVLDDLPKWLNISILHQQPIRDTCKYHLHTTAPLEYINMYEV